MSSKAEALSGFKRALRQRLGFHLPRIMRPQYRIDDFQRCYFVIDDFAHLFDATRPNFTPLYARLKDLPEIDAEAIVAGDRLIGSRE